MEPAAGELDGAFVYDLDDLEGVAREGQANREAAARAAWRVLEEELAAFLRQRAERAAVPSVAALRRHFDEVRAQVLADGGLDAETATRLLVKRLLHEPSQAMREAASADPQSADALEQTVARLFRLEETKPETAEGDGEE